MDQLLNSFVKSADGGVDEAMQKDEDEGVLGDDDDDDDGGGDE